MTDAETHPPAGWFTDPLEKAEKRYWTGSAWSDWIVDEGDDPFVDPAANDAAASERTLGSEVVSMSDDEPENETELEAAKDDGELPRRTIHFAPVATVDMSDERVRAELGVSDDDILLGSGKSGRRTRSRRTERIGAIVAVLALAVVGGAVTRSALRSDGPPVAGSAPTVPTVVDRPDATVIEPSLSPSSTAVSPDSTTTPFVAPPVDPARVEQATTVLGELQFEVFDAPIPYDRLDYAPDGWADLDNDCQTARDEALIEQSLDPVTLSFDGCTVTEGRWRDPWTGEELLTPTATAIAHRVPLGMAHWVGAASWDPEMKQLYGGDPAVLVVVSPSYAEERSAVNPDKWRPPVESAWCGYAVDWIDLKESWGLWVTPKEHEALTEMLDTCQ